MASGIETYKALKKATADLTCGTEFSVNQVDACNLAKLTPEDLITLGCDAKVAEEVSGSFMVGGIEQGIPCLGKAMGLRLTTSNDANPPPPA